MVTRFPRALRDRRRSETASVSEAPLVDKGGVSARLEGTELAEGLPFLEGITTSIIRPDLGL